MKKLFDWISEWKQKMKMKMKMKMKKVEGNSWDCYYC